MSAVTSIFGIPGVLIEPRFAFRQLANHPPKPADVFKGTALWLGALPPVFAAIGMHEHGWRLGTVEPLLLSWAATIWIAILYFGALLFGFLSSALVGRWMAATYGANQDLGLYFGLLTIVGAPLTLGSVMHLYPDVFLNLLVLVPCLIWSMYLLYTGVPLALGIEPERGMLMASSIIGYLFVAFVSLLGISAFLWTVGIGPRIGV
ncbi:MAG: Yip1 family protein [Pseudomonadota bacterium]